MTPAAITTLLTACAGPDSVAALADRCADCHADVAADLATSGHAAPSDLYAALRDHLADPACDACHRPAPTFGCPTCHAAVGNQGTSDGRLVHHLAGPVQSARAVDDAPHRVEAGFPADAALCGTCHDNTARPAFRETPWAHWRDSPAAADGVRCQDCHLRPSPGAPAGHTFPGLAGDADAAVALLASAVRLDARSDGATVTFTLTHVGTGHPLPDGASFLRDLAVEVDGVALPADARLSSRWTADGVEVLDPALADGHAGHPLDPGEARAWTVPAPATACLRFTQERPGLRRLLGLPVDPVREARRDVVCASG